MVGILVVLLIPVAVLGLPILLHQDGGLSTQQETEEEWPLEVTAVGDDGRMRILSLHPPEPGGSIDTSALRPGDRIVVTGTGYDAGQGIYVAICAIPESAEKRPGPCLGGVPDAESTDGEHEIQWAPSNWINNEFGWTLFGARTYDDDATGTFTAYLEVPEPVGDSLDCRETACAIYSRNDHTALGDRVQDVRIPIAFAD